MHKDPHIIKLAPKRLKSYIDAISIYNFDDFFNTTLYPKGTFEIVFQSHQQFHHNTSYTKEWERRPMHFVGGLHHTHYNVKSVSDNNQCLAVQFKPNSVKHFIDEKLHYFQNELISINDLWGTEALTLADSVMTEVYQNRKIELIEDFLIQQFSEKPKSAVDNAIEMIHNLYGFIEIGDLSEKVGLSTSQFRKRFNEEIGISPNKYCKIQRCHHIQHLLEKNNVQSLTSLAYELGYCDQSHFIKDFKSVIGISPGKHNRKLQVL